MNCKKILLIVPDVESFPRPPAPTAPHVGIAYLAAILEKHGHLVEVLDLQIKNEADILAKKFHELQPDIVGISSYSIMYSQIYDLANEVKELGESLVVIGGPHVGSFGRRVLEESLFDVAVRGEGEYTLLDICAEKPFEKIPGLIWRDDKGAIVENIPREPITDLNALPFPAYEKFDLDKYLDKKLIIVSSRGCIKKCLYCTIRYTMGPQFRGRSPQNIVDEIEYWYNSPMKYRFFQFSDDCFSADISRAENVCDEIIKRNLNVGWELRNGIMVNRVNRRLLQKMKDSGCKLIAWGIESIHPETMRNIKKGITPNQVKEALRISNEVGIKNSGFFIIGLPGDTFGKFKENYDFAQSLPLSEVRFYNATPYPSTELYEWVDKKAHWLVNPETFLNDSHANSDQPSFETDEFSAAERLKALKIGGELVFKLRIKNEFGSVFGTLAYQFVRIPFIKNYVLRVGVVVFGLWRRFGKIVGREPI